MADDPLLQRFGREFPRGTVLFREGEPGPDMYVVHSGRVNVSKRVGDVEKILASLGPGEFLGEMSILNNKPRSATATCAEDSKLLVIDAKTFEAMIRGNAEIAIRLIKKLASRVVHYLAVTAERAPRAGLAGNRLELRAAELAARVGVKPEQADEVLMRLLKSRIVAVHADGVLVPDPAKLRQFLEFLLMKARFGDLA